MKTNNVIALEPKAFNLVKDLHAGRPRDIHSDTEHALLYAANGLGDDVTIVDVAGTMAIKSVPAGHSSWGVVIDN